jgi:UDP-2,3-diacylglucosamine pyrophosphatase LpxH
MRQIERHRTVWLSDVHLGSRACRVTLLLDFLAKTQCEVLYLVGDIIDVRSLRRSFFWPKSHSDVLRRILEIARDGTRVIYVPGNHDDDFRALDGNCIGRIEIKSNCVHTTADGKRLLVLHGDEFDSALKCGPLAALIGGSGYKLLLTLNRLNHWINEALGRPYWSLAQSIKMRLSKAVRYVSRFEQACLHAARDAGVDGVVCGHIHRADVKDHDGLLYCNDGDWVESCSALVEDHQGKLSLRHWGQTAVTLSVRKPTPIRNAA